MRTKRTRRLHILGEATALIAGMAVLMVLYACRSSNTEEIYPAGESFFPLAIGNQWIFRQTPWQLAGAEPRPVDTILIDRAETHDGRRFFHLRGGGSSFLTAGLWVRRDASGDLLWTREPGGAEKLFISHNANLGDTWYAGLGDCLDSLSLYDDYAVINTPFGRFDGVRELGDLAQCPDFGWGIDLARGVGPIRWMRMTISGPQEWVLSDLRISDEAARYAAQERARLINGD